MPSSSQAAHFGMSCIPGLSCPLGCSGWLCLLPRQELGEGVHGDSLRKNGTHSTKGRGGATQQPRPPSSTAPPLTLCPLPRDSSRRPLFICSLSQPRWGSMTPSTLLSGIPFQSVPPPDLSRVPPQWPELSLRLSEIPKCLNA